MDCLTDLHHRHWPLSSFGVLWHVAQSRDGTRTDVSLVDLWFKGDQTEIGKIDSSQLFPWFKLLLCVCVRCSSPSLRSISFSAHISTHRWEDKHVCICTFFLICHQSLVLSSVVIITLWLKLHECSSRGRSASGNSTVAACKFLLESELLSGVCVCADPAESCFGGASASSSGLSGFVPGRSCSDRPTWWSLGLFSQQLLQPYLQLNL